MDKVYDILITFEDSSIVKTAVKLVRNSKTIVTDKDSIDAAINSLLVTFPNAIIMKIEVLNIFEYSNVIVIAEPEPEPEPAT